MRSLEVGEAVQRLGPLAYLMHEQDYGLATEQEVLNELATAISTSQGGGRNIENARPEAENYLKRLSERGGMLVKRTSDFYGFFHRTFEEYFAARHVLNKIELQGKKEIESANFVQLVRQQNDLWREPYLLAVAYKGLDGYNDVANQLVRTLFEAYRTDARPDPEQQLADLLLATTAIAESNESAIHRDLKREVADALLQRYTQALQAEVFDACSKIEDVLSEWLLTITRDSYNPPVLEALKAVVYATGDTARQRCVLTLFTMIAQRIVNGAESICAELVPPLMALAGYRTAIKVSATESIGPARNLPMSPDLAIAELARAALSFLDKRGPAGASLRYVRQCFKEQPQYYRHLARYSLENDTLITPTVVPLAEENYRQYEQAIERWIKLRERCQQEGIREQDISNAATIQQELLTSAEEVSYPTVTYILSMLQYADADPEHWGTIWRDYLLTQLNTTGASDQMIPYGYSTPISAIDYREIVFLYTSLFVEEQDTNLIVGPILAHYQSKDTIMQRNAQYLLVSLSEDLRYWRDWRYIHIHLLTKSTAEQAHSNITAASGPERAELLTILAGRLYALEEGVEKGDALPELKMYVSTALDCLHDRATREAALDVVRALPTRTVGEVNYIVEVAQDAQGEDRQKDIQAACGLALRRASSEVSEIRTALKQAKLSSVDAIREAANGVLS